MPSATFEVATLADAVQKAARYAPLKGAALDRSAGILIETIGLGPTFVIRTTDLNIFYRQQIESLRCGEEPVQWLLPSSLFAALIGKLPLHMGSEVTLTDSADDAMLHIRSGQIRAKVAMMSNPGDFPRWEPFDTAGMATVERLAEHLSQVEWATEKKGDGIFTGVHLDGTYLWACDRNAVARVPLSIPVEQPITAPVHTLLSLVKDHPEVLFRASQRVEICTDPDTQVTALIHAEVWPNMSIFTGFEFPHSVVLDRGAVLESIDRILIVGRDEKVPFLTLDIEPGRLRLSMDVPDVGAMREEIKAEADAELTMHVTPNYLRDALIGCRRQEVQFAHQGDPVRPFRITDGLGYEAVAMPRNIRAQHR